MSVTLREVLGAARARSALLPAEVSGYVALAVAEQNAISQRAVTPISVELGPDGALRVTGGEATDAEGAETSVRGLLSELLMESSSVSGAMLRIANRRTSTGMDALVREVEASLIPVNRGAGRRALSRLYRDTARAKESGALDMPVEAESRDVPLAVVSAEPASTPLPLPVAEAPPPLPRQAELPHPEPTLQSLEPMPGLEVPQFASPLQLPVQLESSAAPVARDPDWSEPIWADITDEVCLEISDMVSEETTCPRAASARVQDHASDWDDSVDVVFSPVPAKARAVPDEAAELEIPDLELPASVSPPLPSSEGYTAPETVVALRGAGPDIGHAALGATLHLPDSAPLAAVDGWSLGGDATPVAPLSEPVPASVSEPTLEAEAINATPTLFHEAQDATERVPMVIDRSPSPPEVDTPVEPSEPSQDHAHALDSEETPAEQAVVEGCVDPSEAASPVEVTAPLPPAVVTNPPEAPEPIPAAVVVAEPPEVLEPIPMAVVVEACEVLEPIPAAVVAEASEVSEPIPVAVVARASDVLEPIPAAAMAEPQVLEPILAATVTDRALEDCLGGRTAPEAFEEAPTCLAPPVAEIGAARLTEQRSVVEAPDEPPMPIDPRDVCSDLQVEETLAAAGNSEDGAEDADGAKRVAEDADRAECAAADADGAERVAADADGAECAAADADGAERAAADADGAECAAADADRAERAADDGHSAKEAPATDASPSESGASASAEASAEPPVVTAANETGTEAEATEEIEANELDDEEEEPAESEVRISSFHREMTPLPPIVEPASSRVVAHQSCVDDLLENFSVANIGEPSDLCRGLKELAGIEATGAPPQVAEDGTPPPVAVAERVEESDDADAPGRPGPLVGALALLLAVGVAGSSALPDQPVPRLRTAAGAVASDALEHSQVLDDEASCDAEVVVRDVPRGARVTARGGPELTTVQASRTSKDRVVFTRLPCGEALEVTVQNTGPRRWLTIPVTAARLSPQPGADGRVRVTLIAR